MEAIYTDLHIHTSDNADSINEHYDVNLLINNIKTFSVGLQYMCYITTE